MNYHRKPYYGFNTQGLKQPPNEIFYKLEGWNFTLMLIN
jgi:hypothetical protein